MKEHFRVMSAERVDVIIDFSQYYGQNITLKNVTKTASPETTDVMQFKVTIPLRCRDASSHSHLYKGNQMAYKK